MFTKYNFSHKEIEFATFKPVDPQKEKGFAINFASMGLPQPETKGRIRFVGDYE